MAGIGWGLAFVAIAGLFWSWRQLAAERAHGRELLYAKLDAENQLDAVRAEHAATDDAIDGLFSAAAERFDAGLQSTRAHLQRGAAAFLDYREQVARYDAAVQYCLQPVELILGADKAALERLVHHVEDARRKLFDARAVLEGHPLHCGTNAFDDSVEALPELADCTRDLRVRSAVPSQRGAGAGAANDMAAGAIAHAEPAPGGR